MMTALDHELVQDYLRRLHAETVRLPVPEGRELDAQIREHLAEALSAEPTEAEVLDVLDRLGDPADLVDAAGGLDPSAGTGRQDEADGAWREAGGLLALVGWAVLFWVPVVNLVLWAGGLVLLFLSRRWSVADKVWGAVVLGLGPLPMIILAGVSWTSTSSEVCVSDWTAVPDGGTAPPVVTCTGGGDGGLTTLNIVAWAVTITYLIVYTYTLVRLIRRAAHLPGR